MAKNNFINLHCSNCSVLSSWKAFYKDFSELSSVIYFQVQLFYLTIDLMPILCISNIHAASQPAVPLQIQLQIALNCSSYISVFA